MEFLELTQEHEYTSPFTTDIGGQRSTPRLVRIEHQTKEQFARAGWLLQLGLCRLACVGWLVSVGSCHLCQSSVISRHTIEGFERALVGLAAVAQW